MKVVFFDRDGTIIVEPPDTYNVTLGNLELFPDSLAAFKLLAEKGYNVVLVTNQKGIGDGTISMEEYESVNKKVIELLKPTGINILKTYLCPHTPEDNCDCRKPSPKMLNEAAKEFEVDLKKSFMVGDRMTDIEAGQAAGAQSILVRTGNFDVEPNKADYTTSNILDAVKYIVNN